ncbi:hypothetical protein ACGC1H_001132 [Rhizoctonia solani]
MYTHRGLQRLGTRIFQRLFYDLPLSNRRVRTDKLSELLFCRVIGTCTSPLRRFNGIMPAPLSLTFLGTSAGGGPTPSRGCSSTAISMNGIIWLVDCAEGTQRQMLHAKLKIGRIQKVFVTHLHMDHCMGIAPLMSTLMSSVSNPAPQPNTKRLDIYGPPGLRELLRTILRITQASLSGKYAVHELLSADDAYHCEPIMMHSNEIDGMDFRPSSDGTWKEIAKDGDWVVNAGPIKHRGTLALFISKISRCCQRLLWSFSQGKLTACTHSTLPRLCFSRGIWSCTF